MRVDFYEEFPTKQNLKKLKLISFPCRIILAARSIKEFNKIAKQAKKINKKIKPIYWPLVKNSYWISPFSNTEDLTALFKELDKTKIKLIKIDLEPPFLNKKLIIKNLFRFWKNKKIIRKFLEKNKKRVFTAQLPIAGKFTSKIMLLLGLDYKLNYKKVLMFYTSSFRQNKAEILINKFKKDLEKIKNKENYTIGLGVLAKGRVTKKKLLNVKQLEQDLEFVRKAGFKKIIIFSSGGLNKNYIKVIENFLKNPTNK